MNVYVQTIKKFSELTGISVSTVRYLIKQGVIPEIEREDNNCLQLVNLHALQQMVENNMLRIPRSNRRKNGTK